MLRFVFLLCIRVTAIYLSFPVDSNDSTRGLVDSSHKDSLTADTVHVDTCSRFHVVKVDISKLGNQVDDIKLGTHLCVCVCVCV